MKKTKILFVSLLAMLVVLAGCGQGSNGGIGANNGGEAEGQLIEIEMLSSWSTDTERGRALHDMIDRFNEENAGKIKVNVDINPD